MFLFEIGGFDSALQDGTSVDEKSDKVYTCIRCGSVITKGKAEAEINGAFSHSFTNPHGIMFSIGCFSEAPGCVPVGLATSEFTWFPGYAWRICGCSSCGMHLGWEFSKEGNVFFGLILDNLSL